MAKNNSTSPIRDSKVLEERENLDFSSVAATVEKASTYVVAERLIRTAEVKLNPSAPPSSVAAPLLKIALTPHCTHLLNRSRFGSSNLAGTVGPSGAAGAKRRADFESTG